MEEDFDSLFESINLTGQSQPSVVHDVSDLSLDSQILNDMFFPTNGFQDLHAISADDIQNALIDSPNALFNTSPEHSFESEDIAALISSPIAETPRQSTIEDSMEQMNINQLQEVDALLSSSLPVQVGSAPVEPKEIDNSILSKQTVRNQRLLKNASKTRRTNGYRHASSSVAPIDVAPTYGGCQPCTTIQINTEFDNQLELLQFDSFDFKQIKIKCQPRKSFRPRTENESKLASHFIRCEPFSEFDYPTIDIFQRWAAESVTNIIEVTLVAKDKQPHCYAIDNKKSQTNFDENSLIFRQNDLHTLYFRVTPEDIAKGHKSFMIEYIKSRQNEIVTKELIKTRELDQSMLRFTRIYESGKNNYYRDESSVTYSCIMTEDYGGVTVGHMGPQYGPMGGNERVYALLKGHVSKDDITVFVKESMSGWLQQISFTKSGNLVYFSMPPFPFSQFDRAVVMISIYYKGEEIHTSNYAYQGSLDQVLAALNLSDSNTATNSTSTSNSYDVLDMISATGVCPVVASLKKSSTTKRPKRLAHA
ncbi:hypothetical protein I4U23_023938 [Adineta vaga]|nr:hypothetical protein I4U23_023938 [Adineta vaga]